MKTLHFATIIHARREAVWDVMFAPETYRLWTAEFTEGSYFEGSWAKGARIRFMSPSGGGMTSIIAENRPCEFMSIKHLGYVKDGFDDTESESIRNWAPAFENYSLADADGSTELKVDIEITEEFEGYMARTWPKALTSLKGICEARAAPSR
jgi:hypothetical protein